MKEKVLIVDDVAINRDMLEEALEENYETAGRKRQGGTGVFERISCGNSSGAA